MNDKINGESPFKSETIMNGPIQELEFQVSSVLNRLEKAVEKFDSKGTISSLESSPSLPAGSKSSHQIIESLQDAIVNLNLSKEGEEPNLAILPALKELERLALLSYSVKNYILCLDITHSEYLTNWIDNETSNWLRNLFGFEESGVFFDDSYFKGYLKLFHFLLSKKYPTYSEDGYEAYKENEPVIYYNTPVTYIVAQYLCNRNGLPTRFIREVPAFASKKKDELDVFKRILNEDLNKHCFPLLFIAGAETQITPSHCNLRELGSICSEHKIWLHLSGSFVASFPLLKTKPLQLESRTLLADSISVSLGSWLNVPALPSVILYKTSPDDVKFVKSVDTNDSNGISLPLWTTLQCLGHDKISNELLQKFESCRRLFNKLEKCPDLKMISEFPSEKNADVSITDLIARTLSQFDILELLISTVIFKFIPSNNDLWSSSYCDKLNSWLSQVLHRELPVVPISIAEIKEHGMVLCYSPFTSTPSVSESDWSAFHACLDQQLDILRSTVAQKETLYKLIEKSTCLKMVELPDWAGLGGVRYTPEAWSLEKNEENIKDELNRLNLQIVQQLRNTDSAFSIGESSDGFSCIRFGMVGWDSDVADLIGLVETIGMQEEYSWNFIDTMAEVVKKGIETATQDLQKESDEKLWQEGILRHVPVFGNIVNWWSPLNKSDGGVKGRSLDLTAGVIESTENIYRYHMQGPPKTGTELPPEPSVKTNLLSASDNETETVVKDPD